MALLELEGVSKDFGAIRALSDVSFSIEPGQVVGLMGDNGAGKSTLVKIISGIYQPTTGAVKLEGAAAHIHSPGEARRLGIETVYQ
ncbi:MAG: ATP-binding cassette domain-containing protein, partial [Phycisphaerales bacterium]|nr:ATP-binding cassette domain-containing protein [Phycisphaerales bacterium]